MFRKIIKHWQIILYLTILTILFTIKIINNPLPFFDWDESIYAQVGKEMIQNRSIIPLWQGQNWLDKPPLVPLFYGAVMKFTPFIQPEISTRLSTFYLSVIVLALIYFLYFKVIKEQWLSTFIVIATSLNPIFLQRAQVLNVDIFLLLGWLGYILFYRNIFISLIFLAIAVYSKSAIGFYPAAIFGVYLSYQFITRKIDAQKFIKEINKIVFQILFISLWYVWMYVSFGNEFLYKHFYESHIKRVTSSIEFHFGKRTFYIDILFEEYGKYVLFSILGFGTTIYLWLKKKISDKAVLYCLFLLPWFLFLNLTKTKIFWYGHPYIPQFIFLMSFWLIIFKKARLIYLTIIIALIGILLNNYFVKQKVLSNFYSSVDPHYVLAIKASEKCSNLTVVVDSDTRIAHKTLRDLNLLISTSQWWGNHPSMVYYFNKKLDFVYTLDMLKTKLLNSSSNNCFVVNKNDPASILMINMYSNMIYKTSDPLILYIISP